MGIADVGVDMTPHRAAPATKLIVRAFTGTSLILAACCLSRWPDTISIVQRRRTASSPHPCKVPVSQQHGADSHFASGYVPAVSPGYLSQKLTRPLPTKDGGTLRTVLDARVYMLGLSKHRETGTQWQRAAELLLTQANVADFSKQVELALFYDAKLDIAT